MSFQEILQVKDEILKNNRELEEKIKSHIDVNGNKYKYDMKSITEKIQKVSDSNDKYGKTLPEINYKLSKIEQIEKFNIKTDHKMNSFEFRISQILEQIEKIKTKYDKIVLDNLFVSGHIGGPHCQYANLSEYLLTNINDVSLLKLEKEQAKKDIKNIRSKQDNIIKQTVNLIDGSVKRCNLYTDNKQKDFQSLLDTKMREFNEKIMEIRMNVCKIQMQTEEAVNNLNIGFDKLREENKFFMKDLMSKFSEMKNEMSEFKNEYKSKLNTLYKENTFIKKDTKNIKENIENMLRIIEYQNSKNNKNIKDIRHNFNDSMEDLPKRFPNLKGSYISLMNDNSQYKKRFTIYSPSIKKNKKKLLNSVNVFDTNKPNEVRRSMKKRNTIAYTKPIFDSQTREQLKEKIDSKSRVKSPKFLGVFAPILKNIVNFKDDERSERLDKSCNIKNDDKFFLNSTIKSIKIDGKNSDNNKSEDSKSSKTSNSNSKTDSESNSISVSVSSSSEEKKDNDNIDKLRIKRRPSSKKNFTRLSLKDGKKKTTKMHNNMKNNLNTLNNENQKNNKKNRRRGSVGVFGSVNNMYKNDDISDILVKKFSKYNDNNKNKFIIEDSKNNYIKTGNNETMSQNDKENGKFNENQTKNNAKSRFVTITNNNKMINNNIINQTNMTQATNNRYTNKPDIYSPLSKNHKRNYIITPSDEEQPIGYKIVSFDIPENTNLPQRVNQIYSLNGKKIRKKPNIKPELISPLDELYKQQYKKKMNEMKNLSSNSNMMIVNNANDTPKKLLPIFGRTAYAFYGNNEKDAGINLINSVDLNKNKNTINNFHTISRNYNMNSIQMNNINSPFNIKTFPKLKRKFNTEKNE